MAPSTLSPDTSISSRTLSVGSAQPTPMELSSNPSSSLLASPLTFLQPTIQLNAAFLAAAKRYLDPVAAGISESQTQRQQDARKKRKRGGDFDGDMRVLHLKKVHLDGFGVNQVFEQTRKIVEAATEEIELSLPESDDDVVAVDGEDSEEGLSDPEEQYHTDSDMGEEGVDYEVDGIDDDEDAVPSEEEPSDAEDVEMEDGEEGLFSNEEESDDEPAAEYVPDPNGLNDGFFSIDDFNKQSEFLEQQDARGEAADSDDDEVDWTADPMTGGADKGEVGGDESGDESDEGGPTFGNVDLNAPDGDSDDDAEFEEGDLDGMDDSMNANNVMYADFFAPPAQKAGKNKKKRGRPNPHNFPAKTAADEKAEENADMENAMARVHRDLFEDDDDAESEAALSDLDPSDPKSRKSTHERRQAKLQEEIRKLEAANVAKRQWQLSGEARAADRPVNSLLEENLEFERAGKPVHVVTAELSEDIEALIKRRILAGEFDEVHRRRPDDLATGPVRRGKFELDDTKAQKSLAEMYEEEHLRLNDPNFVDARDEKLQKEHNEITALWKSLSAKLDSLSSSHFKPKPAAPNLEIRVDAPAIEMEDARPTAGGDVASASMLAPQEVYKPGDEENKAEIVTKSGMPLSREELSREEKASRRRRDKERSKKAGLNKPKATKEEKKGKKGKELRGDKKQLVNDLKKGGVQVIGRKGVITDVEGKDVKEAAKRGAGSFKL
ncbi:Mpp10 protein-domain-containing protein [Boeremia exigua]|uniref:Mpp10 protein-domain-containing protein n=1 Tax=Boeremia exigua TaxID=749465 RepID=UPI001E8D13BA|nr:Mpp10 protein-domain-containing protein [Boeremia exigua]KAH6639843.1 Mpp10 protein-domain-containing protein [Boeremia exigua]